MKATHLPLIFFSLKSKMIKGPNKNTIPNTTINISPDLAGSITFSLVRASKVWFLQTPL